MPINETSERAGRDAARAIAAHVDHPATVDGLDLASVKGRARGMRRRRTAVGAAAGALAAVVAATTVGPSVLVALQGDGTPALPPAASPEVELPASFNLGHDLPVRGQTASDAWLFADIDLGPGVPPGGQDRAARLGDTWVVGLADEEGKRWLVLTEPGAAPLLTQQVNDEFVVSDAGDLAAFTTPGGDLVVVGEDGRTRTLAALGGTATPVDVVGSSACLTEDATDADCSVVVSYGDQRAPETVAGDGTRAVIDRDAVAADAANGDLVATRGEADENLEACSTVRSRTSGEVRWESCDLAVDNFSPDGSWAVVVDSYQSGSGAPRVGLVPAATGGEPVWINPDGDGIVGTTTWSDDTHLDVASFTWADQSWRLHRIGLDGTVEQLLEPQSGEDVWPPWIAVTQP